MTNLKTTIFTAILVISCIMCVTAQENAKITFPKNLQSKIVLSFGGGFVTPSSDAKDKAFLSNTTAINADAFFSLINKPERNFSFGLNLGGAYNFGGSGGFGTTPNPFAVTGQTSSVVSDKTVDPKSPGFRMGAGPQANFHFGKFMVSPMVLGEYFSMTQKERSSVQTTQYNGQSYEFNLATLPETKTSGFAVTPKLRLNYMLNQHVGFFTDASYTMGPKTETTVSKLIPNGNPSPQSNSYTLQQLQTGTMVKGETKSTAYKAIGLNFGVVIGLGKKNTDDIKKGWNGKVEKTNKSDSGIENHENKLEEKFSPQIQSLIDEQDAKMNTTFQRIKKSNMKVNSLCNFSVEKVELECNGKDNQGNKKYKVKITYKNLSTSEIGSLGHYITACSSTISNGNYIIPSGSATITSLSPGTSPKTFIPPLGSQLITFDFVPSSGFTSLNIMGNIINSATSCGNCDDIISLNLPNCCDGCELNPVKANNNSIASIDDNNGTINVQNTVSSPNDIVKIEADLVSVKIIPNNNDCLKCNNKIKKQDHFVDKNQIINNTGWANTGTPTKYEGEASDATVSRGLVFTTTSPAGINLSSGAQFNHTIGVAPTSCCGDTVEIWIRYTVWDKDCHVCDKLVKSSIKREPACSGNGSGTSSSQNPSKL